MNSAILYLYYINRSAIYNQGIIAFQMVVLLAWALDKASRYPIVKSFYTCGSFVMLAITCANVSDVFYSYAFKRYLYYKHGTDNYIMSFFRNYFNYNKPQADNHIAALIDISKKYGINGTPALGAFWIAYAELGWKNPLYSLPEPTAQMWAIAPKELVEQLKNINPDRFLYDPNIWHGFFYEDHPLRFYISQNYSNIATPEETGQWGIYVMERLQK